MMGEEAEFTDAATAPIMNRLKKRTGGLHEKLEAFPFFQALMEHKLPLACYVRPLHAPAILHGALEHEIEQTADALIGVSGRASSGHHRPRRTP